MAAWQWVFTSPGMTSRPRQSISRRPGCAARNSAAADSSGDTSAMRSPATPTDPVKVYGPSAEEVIGSTVAFEKSVAISMFRFRSVPSHLSPSRSAPLSIELPCTVMMSRPSAEFE